MQIDYLKEKKVYKEEREVDFLIASSAFLHFFSVLPELFRDFPCIPWPFLVKPFLALLVGKAARAASASIASDASISISISIPSTRL